MIIDMNDIAIKSKGVIVFDSASYKILSSSNIGDCADTCRENLEHGRRRPVLRGCNETDLHEIKPHFVEIFDHLNELLSGLEGLSGAVRNGQTKLGESGKKAEKCWIKVKTLEVS